MVCLDRYKSFRDQWDYRFKASHPKSKRSLSTVKFDNYEIYISKDKNLVSSFDYSEDDIQRFQDLSYQKPKANKQNNIPLYEQYYTYMDQFEIYPPPPQSGVDVRYYTDESGELKEDDIEYHDRILTSDYAKFKRQVGKHTIDFLAKHHIKITKWSFQGYAYLYMARINYANTTEHMLDEFNF